MNLTKSFFLGLFICLVIGALGGAIPGVVDEPAFESTAQFEAKLATPTSADPKFKSIVDAVDVRHNRLIVGMHIILQANEEFKLSELKCFEEYSRDDAFQAMRKRLVVTSIENGLYEARMTAASPDDAQVILNSILATYGKHLAEMSQSNSGRLVSAQRDFERREKESIEYNIQGRKNIKEFDVDDEKKRELEASLIDLELWDPSLGFEPVAYSFAITQPATEGAQVGMLVQWLLMGAGLGAVVWAMLWLLFKMLEYFALIPMATALIGCVGGAALHYTATPVYESKASFQVLQDYVPTNQTREPESNLALTNVSSPHDSRFGQWELVEKVIRQNGLEILDSFAAVPRTDVPELVLRNLSISRDEIEPTIYHVSFRSPNPTDSRTVLENLVNGYRGALEEESQDARGKRIVKVREQLKADYDAGKQQSTELYSEKIQLRRSSQRGGWEDVRLWLFGEASFGKRIWPILTTQLLYGALIGYMLGLGLASIIRASLYSRQPEKAEK